MPASALTFFCLAIFCLFSAIGFLALLSRTVQLQPWQIWATVLLCGGCAVFYALSAAKRSYILFPLVAVVQGLGMTFLGRSYDHNARLMDPGSVLHSQLQLLSVGGTLTLAGGYLFFMLFLSREGERYFRAHTEIALAREVHQALVPEIDTRIGDFEIYGASIPSGEVGGDLVDFVAQGDDWTAYIADVSGHGIAPGVLMAMFKASVRSRILAGCDGASLLDGVHQALYPLKTSNMFVTAGFLQARDGRLLLSLAGHPALLRLQRARVEICEYAAADLPLGILPEQSFSSREIECAPGDILLLLTDGIMESENKAGNELGMDPVKSALRESPDLPLPELFCKIRNLALAFGKQVDDQTMLLVRRLH